MEKKILENKAVARDVALRKGDFLKHGYTEEGCRRCRTAIEEGWDASDGMVHSSTCRNRMREAIRTATEAGRKRVDAAEIKQHQWIADQIVSAEGR